MTDIVIASAPTGVRAALAMTISVIKDLLTGVNANVGSNRGM
jgi:hypothetical protein